MAKPILKEMKGNGDTVAIGVHMRMGDSKIVTTSSWSDHQNYPLGYALASLVASSQPTSQHWCLTSGIAAVRKMPALS